MNFTETPLAGVFVIEPDRIGDERGFLAVAWAAHEFERRGLDARVAQCNISYNRLKGTLRGMHYQSTPFEEVKLIRCTKGAIYDVIIDLRSRSPNFMKWTGVELSEHDRRLLYVPVGFAHGFQTLGDDSEVFYQVSQVYSPAHACGVRWNDPAFAIDWPLPPSVVSARDRAFEDFRLRETSGDASRS